jgi:hypothetical protein
MCLAKSRGSTPEERYLWRTGVYDAIRDVIARQLEYRADLPNRRLVLFTIELLGDGGQRSRPVTLAFGAQRGSPTTVSVQGVLVSLTCLGGDDC